MSSDMLENDECRVSIVIPVFNEEESLEWLIAEVEAAMATAEETFDDLSWEIVCVDDGSSDDSVRILTQLSIRRPYLRILRLHSNTGQSAALAAGFQASRGTWTVTMDADLQNDPADIPKLLAIAFAGKHDVVSGIRVKRRDHWLRIVSSRVANTVRGWILHDQTSDVGCSLRVCRSSFLSQTPVFDGMHRFLPALLSMQGARLTEIPVNHRPRLYGIGKYGVSNRLWRGLHDLCGVRWLKIRSIKLHVEKITHDDS